MTRTVKEAQDGMAISGTTRASKAPVLRPLDLGEEKDPYDKRFGLELFADTQMPTWQCN